jgi:hypothetical protein
VSPFLDLASHELAGGEAGAGVIVCDARGRLPEGYPSASTTSAPVTTGVSSHLWAGREPAAPRSCAQTSASFASPARLSSSRATPIIQVFEEPMGWTMWRSHAKADPGDVLLRQGNATAALGVRQAVLTARIDLLAQGRLAATLGNSKRPGRFRAGLRPRSSLRGRSTRRTRPGPARPGPKR